MLTGDENIIDINFAVFWRISNAERLPVQHPRPGQPGQGGGGELDARGDRPHADPAGADPAARPDRDRRACTRRRQILDQYGAGIEITQVQLQKVDPPAAVIESFRDVQRANTDAERMRNEAEAYHNDIVPRARGDAARIVAEAQGAKQAAVAAGHRPGAAVRRGAEGLPGGQGRHAAAACIWTPCRTSWRMRSRWWWTTS